MIRESEALELAAGVIENGFTQDLYARKADGSVACPASPDAAAFCLVGAVCRALGEDTLGNAEYLVDRWVVPLIPTVVIYGQNYPGSARAWNDEPRRTKAEVAAKLREAAAKAAKEGC